MEGHHHHHHHESGKNLKIAFFLNLGFTILEIIGGFYVNSVAIISDAVHDLGDSLSLGTAWYLDSKSKQSSDKYFSFGYARFSLLGALINSTIMIIGSIIVINEAVKRLYFPETSDAKGMMLFALFGIIINGYAAWKMSGGKTLNEKVVSWHLMEDVLGWVAVFIVAVVLNFKDIPYLDPALSILITLYILWGVVSRLKETFYIFLQGIPADIDLPKIEREILGIDKIKSLHHTHVWSLEGEHHVFTTHIKLEEIETFEQIIEIKQKVKSILLQYHFKHLTIETELEKETCSLINT
jgi:cobalt-zinc-cadmium efflux system protein